MPLIALLDLFSYQAKYLSKNILVGSSKNKYYYVWFERHLIFEHVFRGEFRIAGYRFKR
jgi:hypothetical protein